MLRRLPLAVVCGLVALTVLPLPARGIVVCDDPNAAWHLAANQSSLNGVGYLTSGGGVTAVLIDEWFVLTATHASNNWANSKQFILYRNGVAQPYGLAWRGTNPSVDLAVLRLTKSADHAGYAIFSGTNEQGKEAQIAGYGMSGTPETVGAGGDPNYPRGVGRYGFNKIDAAGDLLGTGVQYLRYDFDSTTSGGPWGTLGADKEVMIALGDSGGPTFIEVSGQLQIAGIHVFLSVNNELKWPQYGDQGYDIRTGSYRNWILSQIPSQPATITGDFNMNGQTNAADIDDLFAHISLSDLWYDMTGDEVVSMPDVDHLIRQALSTQYGDADLNGLVDVGDLGVLAANWSQSGKGWAQGDFNGDDVVDVGDLGILAAYWGWSGGAGGQSPLVVPEPAGLMVLAIGGILLRRGEKIGSVKS